MNYGMVKKNNALYEKVMAKAATDSRFQKGTFGRPLRQQLRRWPGKNSDSFKVKVIEKDPAPQRRLYCRI